MTAVAPQGPLPGSQTPQDPAAASQPLSWEGDKMFNIYIYDYCYKRGFRKTARELLLEAEIPSDSTPPINARQGLLFEWWSVFWVLFTAKANGNASEDAMIYTQHQAHLATMKQNQNRAPPPQQLPMPTSGLMQHQPPMGRPGMNGIGPQRFAPNGVIQNGIPPGNAQPPGPTAFAGGPMPNGIMPGGPPPPGMGQQPTFMGQPRPPLVGQARPPNGGPPFQSPTMAHSPPNPQPQPPQGQPQHAPPMGQLGPPRGGMLPPNQQGMNPGQQTPTPYQNLGGRPPSRTSTPQSGLMNPSPSMAPRQPMIPGADPRDINTINNDFQNIPPQLLPALKNELGLGDKNPHQLTPQDKLRIIGTYRQRTNQKPGPPGVQNAAAGPSMQPPQPRRNNKRNSTSPGEDQQQPDDRNGSSPPDRKRPRRSPHEPPIQTGPMTSYGQHPNQPPQPQPGGPGGPGGPQMGSGMMRPMSGQMGNGGFPQGQPTMQQMSGPMGMLNMNPMMSNPMSNSMSNSMPSSMSPQMHPQQTMGLHNPQQQQHLNRMAGMNAGSPGSDPSFNPGGPMSGGPSPQQQQQQHQQHQQQQQFQAGRLAASGPPNPKPMSMLPPPSPAKDQNKQDNKGPTNGLPDGSPRNQPLSGPNPPGTAPPTPNSSGQQGPPGQGQNMAPAPSPGLMINPNASSMNPVAMPLAPAPPPAAENIFSTDFMQSVTNGLDEFVDVGLFRGDGDLNFERDFGQWFNPDDVGMELGGKQ
ncbi:hypothetical protein B0H19DRAFT_1113560 [Mycena capillaripes]|nr:hypothetical protein B0H19DRAFT_1113560 [Mycena capillaripes]